MNIDKKWYIIGVITLIIGVATYFIMRHFKSVKVNEFRDKFLANAASMKIWFDKLGQMSEDETKAFEKFWAHDWVLGIKAHLDEGKFDNFEHWRYRNERFLVDTKFGKGSYESFIGDFDETYRGDVSGQGA